MNHNNHHHQQELRRKITNNKNHHHPQPKTIININTSPGNQHRTPRKRNTHLKIFPKPKPSKTKNMGFPKIFPVICLFNAFRLSFLISTPNDLPTTKNLFQTTTNDTKIRTHVAWWISTVTPRLVMEECGA